MREFLLRLGLILLIPGSCLAHDIPNARVDRSIQVTLTPGRLAIDYEVSLTELTLTQDLRSLVGSRPGAERSEWLKLYGEVTGPLNAKGLLVTVNGEEVELRSVGFDLLIEGHPIFVFHFESTIAPSGRLTINDTNYLASEGTSRLALRPTGGVRVDGDTLPTDVTAIPIKPVWQLDKDEERRTRRLTVDFALTPSSGPQPTAEPVAITPASSSISDNPLSRLLDRDASRSVALLWLAAFVLGAAHAIQPGHGKTIVLASSLGPGSGPARGALLGLLTAIAHMTSVGLVAAVLWTTRSIREGSIHLILAHVTGFIIAGIGFWKIGRHLAGYGEHCEELSHDPISTTSRGIIPLALAGGAIPCWEAVALVLVAGAIDRLGLGLVLLGAFSLGMATVLVGVGVAASRFRARFSRSQRRHIWERRLGIIGGLILGLIGLSLLQTR